MHNGYRWLIAGTMLGATGAYMMAKKSNGSAKKMRHQAAKITSKSSHAAGDFISAAGDSLADKMR